MATQRKVRFNIVDFLLIVLVILSVVALFLRPAVLDKISQWTATDTVVVSFYADSLTEDECNMLTNGESKITKVVAVMPDGTTGTPCGVCREFMMQLDKAGSNIEILLSLEPLKTIKLGEQLPDWWGEKYTND